MILSRLHKIIKKIAKEGVLALALLLLVVTIGYRFGFFNNTSNETSVFLKENLTVVLPLDEVSVSGTQTFRVRPIAGKRVDEFRWSVDGGVRAGVLGFDGINYTDSVTVDDWNWRKDNRYEIIFNAYQDGAEVASSKRVVYTIEENLVAEDKPAMELSQDAPVVEKVPPNNTEVEVIPRPVVAGASAVRQVPIQFVWLTTEKKDWITQDIQVEFVDTYPNPINVYWSVEGGHENIVNKRDGAGNPILSINFSGWWWKGNGPYPITVTFENMAGEPLAKAKLAFLREGGNNVIIEGLDNQLVVDFAGEPEEGDVFFALNNSINSAVDDNAVLEKDNEVDPSQSPVVNSDFSNNRNNLNDWAVSGLYFAEKPAIQSDINQIKTTGASLEVLEGINFINNQPQSTWLNGNSYDFQLIQRAMTSAQADNTMPVFVLYNIPQRDCGLYSSGGADSYEAYRYWIDKIKQATTYKAVFIIEPDALAMLNCLDTDSQQRRIDAINYAVTTLSKITNSYVYVDAGHAFWVDAKEMSKRLTRVNIEVARGVALNVSNYVRTSDTKKYGDNLSALLGGKGYVIDTSRNGQGPSPKHEWCNPWGRGLGEAPSLVFSGAHDANLWIKTPGESDGYCNGGPNAGTWWRDYAFDLYKNKI